MADGASRERAESERGWLLRPLLATLSRSPLKTRANQGTLSERDVRQGERSVVDQCQTQGGRTARGAGFALFAGVTVVLFWTSVTTLIRFSFEQEQYSHIVLLPLLSGSLFFMERRRIFA